jgi:hypothetical protein
MEKIEELRQIYEELDEEGKEKMASILEESLKTQEETVES